MVDLTLAELRQAELALVSRAVRLDSLPPKKQAKLHEHHVQTTGSALRKVIAEAKVLQEAQDG